MLYSSIIPDSEFVRMEISYLGSSPADHGEQILQPSTLDNFGELVFLDDQIPSISNRMHNFLIRIGLALRSLFERSSKWQGHSSLETLRKK